MLREGPHLIWSNEVITNRLSFTIEDSRSSCGSDRGVETVEFEVRGQFPDIIYHPPATQIVPLSNRRNPCGVGP